MNVLKVVNLIVLNFAICDDIDSVCEYIEKFLDRICCFKLCFRYYVAINLLCVYLLLF